MILVDSSVWIDHLHSQNALLESLLDEDRVLTHPFVLGELAMGNFRNRETTLNFLLNRFRQIDVMDNDEILFFIENHSLAGTGIGYVDAHLLGAAALSKSAKLLTYDKILQKIAAKMGLSANLAH